MGTFLAVGLLMLFLGVAVSAIILRVACGIAGIDPVPDLGRAIMIVLGNAVILFAISVALSMVGLGRAPGLIVSALVSAAVYQSMIPTTYGKGLLIWVVQIAVCFALAFGLSLLFAGMLGGLMMSR